MPRFRLTQCLRLAALLLTAPSAIPAPQAPTPDTPVVAKVEPPNWWIGLTPDLMLLISGHKLEATHVICNLNTVHVSRTQATAGGDYLFVWLKIASTARSGTAVCRVTTATGETSFELPLANRQPTLGKFQGLAPQDSIYLIMPDRFADGDPTNDEPRLPSNVPPDSPAPDSQPPDNAASNATPTGAERSAARTGTSNGASRARTDRSTGQTFDRANPRAYHGGDLRGIRDHLAYLQDLGVTTLWLTPIVKNGAPQDYHGYGAVDLYAVEPHLGTLDDYRQLVAEAHQRKMKIFFDIVPNHVGPLHPWLRNPPLPDWFHGTPQQHLSTSSSVDTSFYGVPASAAKTNDLFETLVDPHAPPSLSRNLTDGWFFGALPDMNTENPVVEQYLMQNAIWWTETSGLDGFRVDTFPYVPRRFWAAWNAGLHAIYPYLTTIGEVFHPDPTVTSFFAGGQRRWDGVDSGVTTVFDYPLYFTLRDILLNGASAGKIAGILREDELYPHAENLVTFFGNHDVPRFASAQGGSLAKEKLAFGLVLTLRGIPELYYGDEIAMPGGADPDNRRDFPGGWPADQTPGDRRPGSQKPNDQKNEQHNGGGNAFDASGRTSQQQELFLYVQSLLRLRREHVALQTGRLWHLFSDQSSYVFLRDTEEEHLLVAFNNDAAQRTVRIAVRDTPLQRIPAASPIFGDGTTQVTAGELQVTLPAQSITIFNLY